MFRKFFQNCRKPEGFLGKCMLRGMNSGHQKISHWGMSFLAFAKDAQILDIGCGGGENIATMLEKAPEGKVFGIDYSSDAVAFSRKRNQKALGDRCQIDQGEVSSLPYADQSFDLVTAFETIYFWPDLSKAFDEIRRVLRPQGQFVIVCEKDDPTGDKWSTIIEGMVIHRGEDLKAQLLEKGFASVQIHRAKKSRLCLIAHNS